ncbi:MAG: DinB family protein [Candidatus Kapaibacterium sp.]
MSYKGLLTELKYESVGTRKLLERIPEGKLGFKPHVKSMELKMLALHVAMMPDFIEPIINTNEIDFAGMDFTPPEVKSTEDILKIFDESLKKALALLEKADDKTLMDKWTAKMNGEVVFELPKISSLRSMTFNHLYHHRGQLTVYLRLLDVPLPAIYGPSADEQF